MRREKCIKTLEQGEGSVRRWQSQRVLDAIGPPVTGVEFVAHCFELVRVSSIQLLRKYAHVIQSVSTRAETVSSSEPEPPGTRPSER